MKKFLLMKTFIFYLFFMIFSHQILHANYHLVSQDVRSFSLGNLKALSQGILNPAYISRKENINLGVSVFNRFASKELSSAFFFMNYPNKKIDAGIRLSSFGYKDYNLTSIQAPFSKRIFPKISLGILLAYINEFSVLRENRSHYYSSHLGGCYTLNKEVEIAFLTENILSNSKINPFSGYLGVNYFPYKDLSLLIEGGYIEKKSFNFSIGLEYSILGQFVLRSGFQLEPKTPSIGISYVFNKWKLDAGFSFHSVLGANSMIAVEYKL